MPAIIIAILSCYRITQAVVREEGLFSVFMRIRLLVGVYDLGQNGQPETELGRLFSCVHCMGIWVAIIIWALMVGIGLDSWWFPLAVAGGQSALHHFLDSLAE